MKRATVAQKRAAFRALHESGCFVIPNPWDVGSARLLEHVGFPALASTSSGHAWSIGKPDYGVTLEDALAYLGGISAAVDVPVNADFEAGFANDPEGVAANVTRAIATGICGISIEDRDVEHGGRLYDTRTAVERVRAARQAIDRSGEDVMLVARTEGLLDDPSVVVPSIDKLVAFAQAGADCLYAPGVWGKADIAAMVQAVAPKPVNVLIMKPDRNVAELAELGVRRISIGGALAAVGWAAVIKAVEEMKAGTFTALGGRVPGSRLNAIFRE
jgi:2-methylisocitrate lyase-like PEP mutase family enzyme